jgi:hypothetical protein
MTDVAAWFQRDEHVLGVDVFVDQTALMDVAERRGKVNGKAQKTRQIERLLPLKNSVERLPARVGENQDYPSFVACERQGLGRPRGLKLGCERVFVLEAFETLGQRLFGGRSDYQKGRLVAVLPRTGKPEFSAIADCLQHVLRNCCH